LWLVLRTLGGASGTITWGITRIVRIRKGDPLDPLLRPRLYKQEYFLRNLVFNLRTIIQSLEQYSATSPTTSNQGDLPLHDILIQDPTGINGSLSRNPL